MHQRALLDLSSFAQLNRVHRLGSTINLNKNPTFTKKCTSSTCWPCKTKPIWYLHIGKSPLLSTDSRIVFGMETKDTFPTVFFFFGFSSTYRDVDLDLCFLWWPEPGTVETLLSGSSLNGEFFLEDSLANMN